MNNTTVSPKTSIAYGPLGLYLLLCGIWWIVGAGFIISTTPEELFAPINTLHSPWADKIMVWITRLGEAPAIVGIGIMIILLKKGQYKLPEILLIIGILSLPSIVTSILKSWANAPRPLTVFAGADWVHTVDGYKNNFHRSWPSGHSTGAFALFFLLVREVHKYYAAILFFCMAMFVAYSRIYLSQHFFEDVYAGSIVGTAVPLICVLVYNNFQSRKTKRPYQ